VTLTSENIRHFHKPCSSPVALATISVFQMQATETTVVGEMVPLNILALAMLNTLLPQEQKMMTTFTIDTHL
jgi:hypothetical protein